jgi:phosphoglycolate phosphatase
VKVSAVIFDLDGTLVDSAPDLRAALNGMLRQLERRDLTASEVRSMIGDGSRALVERALAATGAVTEFETAHGCFLQLYEASPTRFSRLYPDVIETLDTLRETGTRLAICTNKPQAATLVVLEGFGIRNYFEAVLGGDVVPFKKPDPRHLLAAIEQLGPLPDGAVVMIGDNENDEAAARAAGLPVFLLRYGYVRVPEETLAPNAWLDAFPDILRALATLR